MSYNLQCAKIALLTVCFFTKNYLWLRRLNEKLVNHKMPNPVKRTAIIWWVLCIVFFVGIFTPFIMESSGIESGDWAFAVMFLCVVSSITSIIVAIIYTRRARLVAGMLNEKDLLVHWTYSKDEWSSYAEKEYRRDRQEKRNMALLIAVISFVVFIILSIIHPDGWLIFLLTVLGIIAMVSVVAAMSVWMRYRKNRIHHGEVYISRNAVYINEELHVWGQFGAVLEGVSYNERGQTGPLIQITYSSPNRFGPVYTNIRIPIPNGEEETAKRIVSSLQLKE